MRRKTPTPTFGQIRRLLTDLGFTSRTKPSDRTEQTVRLFRHEPSGCAFIYTDRPDAEPMPTPDVLDVHKQLTWRGLIDDIPLEDFLDRFAPAKAG
jgi:hypothetical protein